MRLNVIAAAAFLAPCVALATSHPLEQAPIPIEIGLHKEGKTYYFQNSRGKPFYTYDKDRPGTSNCWEKCIEAWAPLLSRAGAKPLGQDWTLIPREYDRMQWVYKGKPVYFNVAENFLGGDAALINDGHWHVLKP